MALDLRYQRHLAVQAVSFDIRDRGRSGYYPDDEVAFRTLGV